MRIVLGIVCVLLGGWAWIGQIITIISYPLAGKLRLQEPVETIDPICQRAEINTAKWDLFGNFFAFALSNGLNSQNKKKRR